MVVDIRSRERGCPDIARVTPPPDPVPHGHNGGGVVGVDARGATFGNHPARHDGRGDSATGAQDTALVDAERRR